MSHGWRDVDAGRRELNWAVAVGNPAEVDYLTPLGHRTATRMISDLEDSFGPGWLHKATHPACGVAGPAMGRTFASLPGVGAFEAVRGVADNPGPMTC